MKFSKIFQRFAAVPVGGGFNTYFFGGDIRDAVDDVSQHPVTESQAMRVPAYAACIRILSDSISQMPLRLMRKTECGAEEVKTHPALSALADPDSKRPAMTKQSIIKIVVQNIAIHGNGYLEQTRVNGGRKAYSFKPIDPRRVEVCVDDNDRVIYRIKPSTLVGKTTAVQRELRVPDILHFKGTYTDAEGYAGIGSLVTLRDLLRASIEQLYHAKRSLIGGNMKGFVIYPDADITAEQIKAAQDTLNDPKVDQKWKAMPGNPNVIFPPGSNQQSQFVESRRAQIAEYARAFGIPNYMLSDVASASNWGSGLTEQSAGYVRFTLQPMAQGIEGVLDQNVLTAEERAQGMYFTFDFQSFLRGTPNQRADFYQKAIASGWMSPAEARKSEDMYEDESCDGGFKPVTEVQAPGGAPPAGMRPPNQPKTEPEE